MTIPKIAMVMSLNDNPFERVGKTKTNHPKILRKSDYVKGSQVSPRVLYHKDKTGKYIKTLRCLTCYSFVKSTQPQCNSCLGIKKEVNVKKRIRKPTIKKIESDMMYTLKNKTKNVVKRKKKLRIENTQLSSNSTLSDEPEILIPKKEPLSEENQTKENDNKDSVTLPNTREVHSLKDTHTNLFETDFQMNETSGVQKEHTYSKGNISPKNSITNIPSTSIPDMHHSSQQDSKVMIVKRLGDNTNVRDGLTKSQNDDSEKQPSQIFLGTIMSNKHVSLATRQYKVPQDSTYVLGQKTDTQRDLVESKNDASDEPSLQALLETVMSKKRVFTPARKLTVTQDSIEVLEQKTNSQRELAESKNDASEEPPPQAIFEKVMSEKRVSTPARELTVAQDTTDVLGQKTNPLRELAESKIDASKEPPPLAILENVMSKLRVYSPARKLKVAHDSKDVLGQKTNPRRELTESKIVGSEGSPKKLISLPSEKFKVTEFATFPRNNRFVERRKLIPKTAVKTKLSSVSRPTQPKKAFSYSMKGIQLNLPEFKSNIKIGNNEKEVNVAAAKSDTKDNSLKPTEPGENIKSPKLEKQISKMDSTTLNTSLTKNENILNQYSFTVKEDSTVQRIIEDSSPDHDVSKLLGIPNVEIINEDSYDV